MTNTEKERIIALKNQGVSLAKIATELGIPVGTIKTFLRRTEIKRTESVADVCLECGKPLQKTEHGKKKRFCSGACRQKWWNSHLHLVNRKAFYDFTCPWCGKKFTAYGNDHRIYCSRGCYAEARKKNAKLPEHFNV